MKLKTGEWWTNTSPRPAVPLDVHKIRTLLDEAVEDIPALWVVHPREYERAQLAVVHRLYGGIRCPAFAWRFTP